MTPHFTPVFIGLGSNLDDPLTQLEDAIAALKQLPQSHFKALSRIYRSAPVGPQGQPDYLNGVALIETTLHPEQLLDQLQRIENQQKRVRDVRWGPRTLDLDILLFGDLQIETTRLTVPHREMRNRNFVLIPMTDIAPDLVLPDGTKLSVLAKALGNQDLKPVANL